MKLTITNRFSRSLANLSDHQAAAAKTSLLKFMENSRNPGLNFEKVKGTTYCTIRCNQGDRIALRRVETEHYEVVDVGGHDYIYRKYG